MAEALRRILIVDDEPDIVDVLGTYFAEAGPYEVMTAHQGADGVMIADFRRPDAVLLDILMPGMDGVEVLRALRGMDPSIPVVMVTASADEKIARDTLTMGAFDYLRKPFDFDVLRRTVTEAVAAGASRGWSPFGADRAAAHTRALRADAIIADLRSRRPVEGAPALLRRAVAV